MIWLILFLEHLEVLLVSIGQTQLAGQVCHLAVALGMFGPCLPG